MTAAVSEYRTDNLDSETIKSLLIERMKSFRALAAKRGHPLQQVYLDTATPGILDDTYTIKVISDWIGETGQSKALDILIPIFWETFEIGLRKHIFSLFMYAKPEDLFRVSAEQYAVRHAELV